MRARPDAAPATLPVLATIVSLVAVIVLSLTAGEAIASHVSCGETITTDTTLDTDLEVTARATASSSVLTTSRSISTANVIDGDGTEFAGCGYNRRVLRRRNPRHRPRRGGPCVMAPSMVSPYGVFVGSARDSRVLSISARRNILLRRGDRGGRAEALVRNCSLSSNIPPEGDGHRSVRAPITSGSAATRSAATRDRVSTSPTRTRI